MLADDVNYLIGVDTHRDEHAVAVIDRLGSMIIEAVSGQRGGIGAATRTA